jgi:hypothetical protein
MNNGRNRYNHGNGNGRPVESLIRVPMDE